MVALPVSDLNQLTSTSVHTVTVYVDTFNIAILSHRSASTLGLSSVRRLSIRRLAIRQLFLHFNYL